MPLLRSGFEVQFEELRAGVPALGRAAVLPWDTEIFGFPVASYRVEGDDVLDEASRKDLAAHFHSWMTRHDVSVCGCAIPAGSLFWKSFLPELGFRFVDFGIEARIRDLASVALPEARTVLRSPEPGDRAAIETLAARSFAHGRYFADALFPRELARHRYQRWIANALAVEGGPDRIYVLGERGSVDGFFHLAIQGQVADLRLAAVAPEFQGTGMGWDLYVSVLHELRRLRVRKLVTSISVANTAILNLYSMLGFRFAHPEAIYHWHAGGTPRDPASY
ncbi:MAG: GNAT family N-acetyltransferase [Bryobacteraceae bacterium]